MAQTHIPLREIHNLGSETQERLLTRFHEASLARHGLYAVGCVAAAPGYFHAAIAPMQSLLYACHGGRGEVFVNGRWASCGVGMTYFAPAYKVRAYRTIIAPWCCTWILGESNAFMDRDEPALVSSRDVPLWEAVRGLLDEEAGQGDALLMESYMGMILGFAERILRMSPAATRLQLVWQQVTARPEEAWTLLKMAALVNLSEESVRRLCRAETGRSPMQHVIYLRMRMAATLLFATRDSIPRIAEQVGYTNSLAFSTAFRRMMGVPPSHLRRGTRATMNTLSPHLPTNTDRFTR